MSEYAQHTADISLDEMLMTNARHPMEWQAPTVFNLDEETDREKLEERFRSGEVAGVVDRVQEIADESFELKHPDKKDEAEMRADYVERIRSQGIGYGNWVLFPWSGELVRYPDVDEHRALRTARFKNLVTEEEQGRLYDATTAVYGLSVGSSVVEALAMAGIGGTIIMGDPDKVSPSNLGRLKAGFQDVGARKIDLMARRVSEIDPYITQVHFSEGVSGSNLGALAIQKPDVLFDEVDHMPSKALMRDFASREGIPLVMATDLGDRSIIDVERHDQETVKPFNGRLKAIEFDALLNDSVGPREIGKMMMKIVGVRHITVRMLDSFMEVGKTLSGIPQLGVTANVGGSLAAISAREILLGRDLPSGRYVFSPKKTLSLAPQATVSEGISTIRRFAKNR